MVRGRPLNSKVASAERTGTRGEKRLSSAQLIRQMREPGESCGGGAEAENGEGGVTSGRRTGRDRGVKLVCTGGTSEQKGGGGSEKGLARRGKVFNTCGVLQVS